MFVAVVVLAGGLLMLAGVFWWRSGRTPIVRFLSGQQIVYHHAHREGSVDIYCWPAEFESLAAQAREELLRAGFVEVSVRNHYGLAFSRARPRQVIVCLHHAQFVQATDGTWGWYGVPGWVAVEVRYGRLAPFQDPGYLWHRVRSPKLSFPPPQSATGE
jgi:hypothetical protein